MKTRSDHSSLTDILPEDVSESFFDALADPQVGWEVRVALDGGFRALLKGLKEKPSQKPILVFLPKGGPLSLLGTLLGILSCGDQEVVCLVEDETIAVDLDTILQKTARWGYIKDKTRIVIGDLKHLAKTDKGCYGGCVILAYGVTMPSAPTSREHTMYIADKAGSLAQLLGWSAHVLYLERIFHDAPDDVLESLRTAETSKRKLLCALTIQQDVSKFGQLLMDHKRRVTLCAAELSGATPTAAVCFYAQVFKVTGNGRGRTGQEVPATILATEESAIGMYRSFQKLYMTESYDMTCVFMHEKMFESWMAKFPKAEFEKNEPKKDPQS